MNAPPAQLGPRHPARPRPVWFHHLMALVTISIWSFSFLFIVKVNRELPTVSVVILRFDIFFIFIVALALIVRPWPWLRLGRLTQREWMIIIALSLVAGPFYHHAFSWAAGQKADGGDRIDPAMLGLILATVPVHAAWLGRIFLGERLGWMRIGALALGLAGVFAVLLGRQFAAGSGLPTVTQLEGPLGAVFAAVVAGGIVVLTRGARKIYAPVELVIVSGTIMVLWNALLHPWAEVDRWSDLTTAGWGGIIFLGLMGNGVAFLTWASALSGLRAVTAAMYLFLASVLAALWAWLFDATPIGWPFLPGAALVLVSLVIMARAAR